MSSSAKLALPIASAGAIMTLMGCAQISTGQLEETRSVHLSGGVLEVSVQGEGSPVVVFESGAGARCHMGTWSKVVNELAGETTLFAYNRSGYGRSRIRASLDSPGDVVELLHRALEETEVEPPYLLVGHSLGGLYMNLFARLYPDETVGLVLLDSSHPDQFEYLRQEKPLRHAMMIAGYSTASPHLRYELANMNRFHLEVAEAGPFPSIPIVVLTAGTSPLWQSDEERQWWLGLQRELATLSDQSRAEIVEESGHFIQEDRPDVVVEAIRRLLVPSPEDAR